MTSLSERATLAKLSIGAWSGKMLDREVTEEVSEKHKADLKDAGRYNKQLIASRFLKPIGTVISAARRTHQVLTLPWDDRNILSNTMFQHYTEQMRLHRHKFEAGKREFAAHLDEYKKEAEPRLGTMFNAEDYPSSEDVEAKFWFDVEISAVPEASDFRSKLSDASVKAIVKDIERRADQRLEAAMNDVFQRILDAVGRMAERLKTYKPPVGESKAEGTFRDSLVYNIQELADLLPALNLTGDKRLDVLQKQLVSDLVQHSPEILRADPKARSETARKAEKIYDKVKKYMA